jgi:Tol biopolymer transport system component
MTSPVPTNSPPPTSHDRLNGWKEIAAFLGRGVRTVQRWETALGLPVHRLRHERGEVVFAYRSEVEAWLREAGGRRAMAEAREAAEVGSPNEVGRAHGVPPTRLDVRGVRVGRTPAPPEAASWRRGSTWLAFAALLTAGLAAWAWLPARQSGAPVGMLRQLTSAPGWESEAAISPDGRFVAYSGNVAGVADIWIVDARGGEPRRLTASPARDRHPAWFPDGSALAFVSDHEDQAAVWTVPRAGGAPVLLLANADEPAISPDGTRLAFVRPGDRGEGRIFVAPISDLASARAITRNRDGLWNHQQPAWSPDGDTVCYAAGRDLWIVPAGGGSARRLTTDGEYDREPWWAPDGRHVYFSSYRDGNAAIWRVPTSGGRPERITAGSSSEWFPSVSRDGSHLAYATYTENPDVFVRDLVSGAERRIGGVRDEAEPVLAPDGRSVAFTSDRIGGRADLWHQALSATGEPEGEPRRLTETSGSVSQPSYSPDGRWIAYHQVITGQRDIWVVAVTGGPPVRVTDDPAIDIHPEWSPDGRAIVFVSERFGAQRLWIVPMADGRPSGPARPLNPAEGDAADRRTEEAPAWSPDSSAIAFIVANDRDGREVWTAAASGGEARPLTTGARAQRVAWDPSSHLLLVSGYWGSDQISIRRIDATVPGAPPSDPLAWLGAIPTLIDFSLSRDGRLLAFARPEPRGDVWILDAERGKY